MKRKIAKGLCFILAPIMAANLWFSSLAYSKENSAEKNRIKAEVGFRYNIRGEDEEEPHESFARVSLENKLNINNRKVNASPYIYGLYDMKNNRTRRVEIGADIGFESSLFNFLGYYLGLRPKFTDYSYKNHSTGELGIVVDIEKSKPLKLGFLNLIPYFSNECVLHSGEDKIKRNEFEAGIKIPVKDNMELKIAENHIDEAYGGPDSDMVLASFSYKF